MNIGPKLKEIRKKAGLTQKQLATKLGNGGYTEFTVSVIESGKRNVGFDVCNDWASACGFKMSIEFIEDLNAVPILNDILLQVKAKGCLSAQDVEKFNEAGVNIVLLFGALTDGNTAFNKRLKKGEITYDEVIAVLK